jgi:hypothetical protein
VGNVESKVRGNQGSELHLPEGWLIWALTKTAQKTACIAVQIIWQEINGLELKCEPSGKLGNIA